MRELAHGSILEAFRMASLPMTARTRTASDAAILLPPLASIAGQAHLWNAALMAARLEKGVPLELSATAFFFHSFSSFSGMAAPSARAPF